MFIAANSEGGSGKFGRWNLIENSSSPKLFLATQRYEPRIDEYDDGTSMKVKGYQKIESTKESYNVISMIEQYY